MNKHGNNPRPNDIELQDIGAQIRNRSNTIYQKPADQKQGIRNNNGAMKPNSIGQNARKNAPHEMEMIELPKMKMPGVAQQMRNTTMQKVHAEIGSNRSPVMGEANEKRNIGLMMRDARLDYQIDRSGDHKGFFGRAANSGKQAFKDLDKVKTAVTLIPGVGLISNIRDAYHSKNRASRLSTQKEQFNKEAAPLFETESNRLKNASTFSALKVADPTPYGLFSKGVVYGNTGKDIATDKSRNQRIDASILQQRQNEPMLPIESHNDNQAKRHKFATQQNQQLFDLAVNDRKANQAARNLLTSAFVSNARGHQSELKHHSKTLRGVKGHISPPQGVDTTPNLKPSEVKRQIQSEQAIKNLRKK